MADESEARRQSSADPVKVVSTGYGKGYARRLRAAGKIPAVIYGHGVEPQHIVLPGHQISLLIRKANQVLDLQIEGMSQLALVKDVQKDPVREIIEHIDLIVVRKGEEVVVDVPVRLEGDPAPGTSVNQDSNTISLRVEVTHIPECLVISVAGLSKDAQILAKDVPLPKGATLNSDPDTVIVSLLPSEITGSGSIQERFAALVPFFGHDELGHILRLTHSDLLGFNDGTVMRPNAVDAIVGLERVTSLATSRWGNAAADWLHGPNIILEGARPVDVLELNGAEEVIRAIRLSAA